MLGTYASAALICAASLLIGRALLSVAGRNSWSWLEPAVGFGAVLSVTGLLAACPGHGTSATLGCDPAGRRREWSWCGGSSYDARGALRRALAERARHRAGALDPVRDQRAMGARSASASTTTSASTSPGPSGCAAASGPPRTPATRLGRTGWRSRSPPCPGSAWRRRSSGRSSRSGS